jgi:hypothetical protein
MGKNIKKLIKLKRFLIIILVIIGILSSCVVLLYIYSFDIIKAVGPKAASVFGIKNMSFDIKTLNSSEIHLTDLSTGTVSHQGLFLKDLLINRSKSRKSPNKLILEGLHLNVWVSKDGVVIPGVEMMRSSAPSLVESERKAPGFIPALLRIPEFLAPYMEPGLTLQLKRSFCTISRLSKRKVKKVTVPLELLFSIGSDGSYKMDISSELNEIHKVPFLPDEIKIGGVKLKIHSKGLLYTSKGCENFKANLLLDLKDVIYLKKGMSVKIPRFKINAEAAQDNNTINCSMLIAAEKCSMKSSEIKIPSFELSLPITFQYTDKFDIVNSPTQEKGFFNISNIRFKTLDTGKISFKITQNNNIFSIESEFSPKFIKFHNSGGQIYIKSEVKLGDRFQLLRNKTKIRAENFSPADIVFGDKEPKPEINIGLLTLNSVVKEINGRIKTSARLKIENTNIFDSKNNLTLKGVNAECGFPFLSKLQSLPAQKIQCSFLQIGNIKFSNLFLNYQIESQNKILLEKTTMKWCGGNIDLGALRINLKKPDNIAMTLFCDRINVAELMSQLKIAEAEGNGTVAGRIPLSYQAGLLRIDNAFLYSIPGQGGTIRIKDFADSYLNTSASAPLDIAKEALADYKYKWIKLLMNSKEGNLFIKLELDGAPNKKLPFTFDSQEGNFVRNEDNSKTAHFQGISFEFNFNNIPLDSILNIGRSSSDMLNFEQ